MRAAAARPSRDRAAHAGPAPATGRARRREQRSGEVRHVLRALSRTLDGTTAGQAVQPRHDARAPNSASSVAASTAASTRGTTRLARAHVGRGPVAVRPRASGRSAVDVERRRPPFGIGSHPYRRLDHGGGMVVHHSTCASTSLRVQPVIGGRRRERRRRRARPIAASIGAWRGRRGPAASVLSMARSLPPARPQLSGFGARAAPLAAAPPTWGRILPCGPMPDQMPDMDPSAAQPRLPAVRRPADRPLRRRERPRLRGARPGSASTPRRGPTIAAAPGTARTLRDNVRAWDRVPAPAAGARRRLGVDPGDRRSSAARRVPFGVAPAALHGLAHPDGELATARAAAVAGAINVVSTVASRRSRRSPTAAPDGRRGSSSTSRRTGGHAAPGRACGRTPATRRSCSPWTPRSSATATTILRLPFDPGEDAYANLPKRDAWRHGGSSTRSSTCAASR